jgi:hypothetical protein
MRFGCALVAGITLGASVGFAEHRVGNGGDVAICGETVEVLDLHEARADGPFDIDLGDDSDTLARATYAVEKLRTLDPELHGVFSSLLLSMWSDRELGEPMEIADEGRFWIDSGCRKQQLAIQMGVHAADSIVIDPALWSRLSADHQAASLLHEVVYSYLRDKGQVTSELARRYVRFLVSRSPGTITPDAYAIMKRDLGLAPKDLPESLTANMWLEWKIAKPHWDPVTEACLAVGLSSPRMVAFELTKGGGSLRGSQTMSSEGTKFLIEATLDGYGRASVRARVDGAGSKAASGQAQWNLRFQAPPAEIMERLVLEKDAHGCEEVAVIYIGQILFPN